MIPDVWEYRRASRLIEEHGDDALRLTAKLIAMAIERRQQERAVLMFRVRLAVKALQAPQTGPLH